MSDNNEQPEKKSYHFGEKLRISREKKHLTLKAVAQKANVSESLISQIEHNKVSPAIDTLLTLANVLDINLEYLFEEYSRQRPVTIIRSQERRRNTEENILYEEISDPNHAVDLSLESYIVTIPENSHTHRGNYGHIGKEIGLILQGKATLHYGQDDYQLEEGDSVTFTSNLPHSIENTGKGELKALWIVTPAQKFE